MPDTARATVALVAILLGACDTVVEPDPGTEETLAGRVSVYSQRGQRISVPGVTVTVQNALGRTVVLPVAEDDSWAGSELGPEPYVVTAQAEGFAGLAVVGARGGTSGVHTLLMERSTVQVLGVDEAVLRDDCNPYCLYLRFTVADDGSFPHGSRTQWLRLFIGDSAAASPENYHQSLFLIVADDDPRLERGDTRMTMVFDRLRSIDFESLDLDELSVYLVGATGSQVGFWGPELTEAGWPDLAERGVGAVVTR